MMSWKGNSMILTKFLFEYLKYVSYMLDLFKIDILFINFCNV